jgi:hypothetical protein
MVLIGDQLRTDLEPVGDGGGQHVQQPTLIVATQPVHRKVGLHPCQQFVRVERLGDVVHGTDLEALQNLNRLRQGGEENHRDVATVAAPSWAGHATNGSAALTT